MHAIVLLGRVSLGSNSCFHHAGMQDSGVAGAWLYVVGRKVPSSAMHGHHVDVEYENSHDAQMIPEHRR